MTPFSSEPRQGALFIPCAKIYFIFSSYVIYIALSRFLTVEQFGSYGVVIGMISVLNMMFIQGSIQAFSKLVSEGTRVDQLLRRGHLIEVGLGFIVFGLVFIFAPFIAGFLNDASLVMAIRLASFITLFYSVYAVHIGILNGLKRFRDQGLFDIGFATIKTVSILILASTTRDYQSAVLAFALSAAVIYGIAFCYLRGLVGSQAVAGSPVGTQRLLYYQFSIMWFALMMNLVINTDLFLVKRIAGDTGAGLYTATLTISRIPYMVLASLNVVIFPLISHVTFKQDLQKSALYIQRALRIVLGLALPLALFVAANADEVIRMLYPENYGQASDVLRVVALGYVGLTVFVTMTTIITSSGMPMLSLLATTMIWLVMSIGALVLIPKYGLMGAAYANLLCALCGVTLGSLILLKRFKTLLPFKSLIRLLALALLLYGLSRQVPLSGLYLIGEGMLVFAVYVLGLYISRELSAHDLKAIGQIICFKAKK